MHSGFSKCFEVAVPTQKVAGASDQRGPERGEFFWRVRGEIFEIGHPQKPFPAFSEHTLLITRSTALRTSTGSNVIFVDT